MREIRTYSKLIRLPTFEERYRYLKLSGVVGATTFGFERMLNQMLYTSQKWRSVRRDIIMRDNGCDLGIDDRDIVNMIIVHHMNPITIEQVERDDPIIYNQEFLICTSDMTHKAIHYGDEDLLIRMPIERRKNDTCPWLK